jgi:hypothetical protein
VDSGSTVPVPPPATIARQTPPPAFQGSVTTATSRDVLPVPRVPGVVARQEPPLPAPGRVVVDGPSLPLPVFRAPRAVLAVQAAPPPPIWAAGRVTNWHAPLLVAAPPAPVATDAVAVWGPVYERVARSGGTGRVERGPVAERVIR